MTAKFISAKRGETRITMEFGEDDVRAIHRLLYSDSAQPMTCAAPDSAITQLRAAFNEAMRRA